MLVVRKVQFNMSSEILSVLEYMEKEKGIPRQEMIDVIIEAIKGAAQKGMYANQDLKVQISPRTGALKAWLCYKVVDSVSDFQQEIHIENARKIDPNIALGSVLEKELDPTYLGRIAAQTARQTIMQKVRSFEKERIYEEFKDQVGDIVSGTVRRREGPNWVIDLGKADAMLPFKECIPNENYAAGDRIRCLLLSIENTMRGPEIVLSRSHSKFVRRLLELEVTEIGDNTISINMMVREPGYRTKIAVSTKDPKVDPVGACVGARGARVKVLVRELNGEKIDVLRYEPDILNMLKEAFRPVVLKNIEKDDVYKRIAFEVSEEDISSVIGRGGLNAKLTSRLLGWKLDINKSGKGKNMGFADRVQKAVEGVHKVPGLEQTLAKRLVAMGITSPEAFEGVTATDLMDEGFTEEEAKDTFEKFTSYLAFSKQADA